MLVDYVKIKMEYDGFYNDLMSKGRLPLKNTQLGYWSISTADDLWHLFKKTELDKHKNFLDLGSGDGKAVMVASLFTKATGIEIDDELHDAANNIKKKLKLTKASFKKENFMKHDISKYDYIFFHPDSKSFKLNEKFKKELRGKLFIYGDMYHPVGLEHVRTFNPHTTPVTLYENK